MSTPATRAKDRYNQKAYDEIKLRVPKGKKDIIDQAAEALGVSRNAFIAEAIEEKMRKHNI